MFLPKGVCSKKQTDAHSRPDGLLKLRRFDYHATRSSALRFGGRNYARRAALLMLLQPDAFAEEFGGLRSVYATAARAQQRDGTLAHSGAPSISCLIKDWGHLGTEMRTGEGIC
jgi:hypothetical protein